MQSITFECEVITPMFLAGADGTTPELRPPSIKGALRFWWRALNGHLGLGELKRIEGEIFGSTKKKSKVIIQLPKEEDNYKNLKYDNQSKYSMLPHKNSFFKECFPIKSIFRIKLSLFKNLEIPFEKDKSQYSFSFKDLENLFIIVSLLGGLGKRSRRGLGAFKINRMKKNEGKWNDYKMPTSINEIKVLLSEKQFKVEDNCIKSFNFKENYPYLKKIELGENKKSYDELLKIIGKSSSKAKKDNDNRQDYKNSLGQASKRFASPIFTSISATSKKDEFIPIISTLNIALDGKNKPRNAYSIQENFKREIL